MKTVLDSFWHSSTERWHLDRPAFLAFGPVDFFLFPVDGGHIAQVSETTTAQYHEVIEAAQAAQAVCATYLPQSAAKLFAFLATNCASKKKHRHVGVL